MARETDECLGIFIIVLISHTADIWPWRRIDGLLGVFLVSIPLTYKVNTGNCTQNIINKQKNTQREQTSTKTHNNKSTGKSKSLIILIVS